jgi:isopentenyldiphosphate isomerase
MVNLPEKEWFPIVDEEGNQISIAPRSVCHDGKSKLLHPVVHLHLFNNRGELFLQKRAAFKDILPGFWDSSVGGHVSPGETIEDALKRESAEELGLEVFDYQFRKKYIWESERERELVYSFTGSSTNVPEINRDEIEDGMFWTLEDINLNLGKGIFTPNFENEFRMIIFTQGNPEKI